MLSYHKPYCCDVNAFTTRPAFLKVFPKSHLYSNKNIPSSYEMDILGNHFTWTTSSRLTRCHYQRARMIILLILQLTTIASSSTPPFYHQNSKGRKERHSIKKVKALLISSEKFSAGTNTIILFILYPTLNYLTISTKSFDIVCSPDPPQIF